MWGSVEVMPGANNDENVTPPPSFAYVNSLPQTPLKHARAPSWHHHHQPRHPTQQLNTTRASVHFFVPFFSSTSKLVGCNACRAIARGQVHARMRGEIPGGGRGASSRREPRGHRAPRPLFDTAPETRARTHTVNGAHTLTDAALTFEKGPVDGVEGENNARVEMHPVLLRSRAPRSLARSLSCLPCVNLSLLHLELQPDGLDSNSCVFFLLFSKNKK